MDGRADRVSRDFQSAMIPYDRRLEPEYAFELGGRAAAMTHGHPSGYLSAAMVASIIQFDCIANCPLWLGIHLSQDRSRLPAEMELSRSTNGSSYSEVTLR